MDQHHRNSWLIVAIVALISLGTLSSLMLSGEDIYNAVTGTSVHFALQKKAPRFKNSTPSHGSVVAGVPTNIVIDSSMNLVTGSTISVINDKKQYGTGQTAIDPLKLSMRRNVDPSAPDGMYTVNYKACHQDGKCYDGKFQFFIDRKKAEKFKDLRGQTEVTVKLSRISFKDHDIRVSHGTKVIWVNEDKVEHYVNTDAHTSHTYFPQQNSGLLMKGEMFSVTFDKPGIYPYHCSAHMPGMTGNILVE